MSFVTPDRWTPAQTAGFLVHHDVRDLLVIEHPWIESHEGGFGQWEVTLAPPEGWQPGEPLFVSFYQSDNYSGTWREDKWMGAQVFLGHRFKQLLVNGRLVWESDVADEEREGTLAGWFEVAPGEPGYRDGYVLADIAAVAAETFTLTFRVVDKVASTTSLPGDAYQRFSWSPHNPHEAALKFQTTVFFGDIALTRTRVAVRREEPPVAMRSRETMAQLPAEGIRLPLVLPDTLPTPGYPVRCGVPFPRGAVQTGTPCALYDTAGAVPTAIGEISHWPDGSVRWVLCEFVATRAGDYHLRPGEMPAAPAEPVQVEGHTLTNGPLTLDLGEDGVFATLAQADGLTVGPLDLSIKLNRVGWRDQFTGRRTRATVEKANAVCATVLLEGDMLDEGDHRFGPWRARLHLWAGLPYLLGEWTLTNESDQAMAMLLDWSARLTLPALEDAVVDFGPFTPGYDPEDIGVKAMGHYGTIDTPRALPLYRGAELSCRQERVDQARIYRYTTWVATADTTPGFINLQHPRGGFTASMRWFKEEFPKGLVVRPDLLKLATLPESEDALAWPHDRPSTRIGRGEAKRQAFALWLHDGALPAEEAERFNACVQDVPHLFDPAWFIAAEVVEAGPPRAAVPAWQEVVAPAIARTGIDAPRLGHREYWDTCWGNDYRGRTHISLLQYLETGDPRWFRYFNAAITHNRDVDIIHFCPEHPDWVGAGHEYGEDHTAAGPSHNISMNVDGMLDHYLLTGDPDSLAAAQGFAERLLTCTNDRCARVIGWPISQLVRWHGQSGDARFLRKAEEMVASAFSYTEPRRGVFSEMHGCWNYLGAVSFMTGYLAFGLIRYHQATGDPAVLALLSRLADGAYAEIRPVPGRFRYSPFPENNPVPYARWHNALLGGLFGYLALRTDIDRYAEWARECYDALVEVCDEPTASMDMLHPAGWMLMAVAEG